MALNERLQILVTADGKGAMSEFARIGDSAERELGRTDDRIKRLSSGLVSAGTQIALAGGVATAGLFSLASAAGDYEEAASAAGVIFGQSAEDIERFGREAINTAGLSRRAAVEAANTFGTFGKAANLTGDDLAEFSTELTQLAGDLASFKNTSTEEAILAIGAALRGESEPIRKYGVLLDDALLKQRAFEMGLYDGTGALDQQAKVLAAQAEILAQTSDAQGDFARTSDSLSNQTKSFSAEMENLKVSLGEGAVPVFSELVSAANSALGAFQDLSPETQTLVGRIGALGALGVTAVGGLTALAGGALRLVDTLRDISARASNAEGAMGRLSRAGVIAGGALGAAGTAYAVYQLAQALRDAATDAVALETAINDLEGARTAEETRRAIMRAADEMENWVSDIGDFAKQQTGMFNDWAIEANGLRIEFDNLDGILNEIKTTSDSVTLQRVIDEIRAAAEASDLSGSQLESVNEVLGKYQANLDSSARAEKRAAGSAGGLADATGGAAGELGALGTAAEQAAEQTNDFNAALDGMNKLVELSGDLFDVSAKRAQGFLAAIEDSSAIDDLLGATLDLRDSSTALLDGVGALAGVNIEQVASGFGAVTDEAAEALRDVLAVGEDAQASIAAALQFQGADVAREKANQIRDGLIGVLDAAGVADDQIQYLLESIGLTPEQVDVAISVSGTNAALAELAILRDFLTNADGSSGIPPEVQSQIVVALNEGRAEDARNLLRIWIEDTQDGLIQNPLLIALGLGSTQAASEDVDAWKREVFMLPPAMTRLGVNDQPARAGVEGFRTWAGGQQVRVQMVADFSQFGVGAFPIFQQGTGIASPKNTPRWGSSKPGGRATGGRVEGGGEYFVNEPSLGGELFRPSTDGFVMNAADTDRLLRGVESLVSGSTSGASNTFNIYGAADPMATAEEIILAARAERHLVGA